MKAAALALLLPLAGCSWLTDYGHCTVEWSCDECNDVKVEFQHVKSMDSKEAELPGG